MIRRRVIPLPWWPCQLCDGVHPKAVALWRGRVRCRCQMSRAELLHLAHDRRQDNEERSQLAHDIRLERTKDYAS